MNIEQTFIDHRKHHDNGGALSKAEIASVEAWESGDITRAIEIMPETMKSDDDSKWDEWYSGIPKDISSRLSLHDFKRLGNLFAEAFNVR